MTVERHLILQELTLQPSAEWFLRGQGWVMLRVVEGTGYWLQHDAPARELSAGAGLIASCSTNGLLRASQLGPLKLQFFTIQPQYLNGLLTIAEWQQFEITPQNTLPHVSIFTAGEPIGQRFTRLSDQSPSDKLPMRCALLQLWANGIAGFLTAPVPAFNDNKLRERFRQMVGQMPEAELSECSLPELAQRIHCSERHFSRLFREEFGVPLRTRQIELRLQRARQLLTDSNAKIINVAYESGYRHLSLFNVTFKKRFGVTPGEWRRQSAGKNLPAQSRNSLPKFSVRAAVLIAALLFNFISPLFAQTNSPVEISKNRDVMRFVASVKMAELTGEKRQPETAAQTNAIMPAATNFIARPAPKFRVDKYLVEGNSILPPETIAGIFTNVPAAFGTNVTFDAIRTMLTDFQAAYRARGFTTVSVGLPQQKITNATVKVKVIEGRLVAINVTGNRYFSSNNVMSALPDLQTNMLLNSLVFQRELDNANMSRDRQIYPVIGPGPDPGTSELTLKVKDRLPFHSRLEINNIATPDTPDLRANFTAQYDNLWDLEHQVGLQYSFAFEKFKNADYFSSTPFDDPLIANYSAYYRLPIGGYSSVQEQVDNNPSSFGYSEVTHRFNLPPPTGRPSLTFYVSRSTTDTGTTFQPPTPVTNGIPNPNFTITNQNSGEIFTVNEGLGARMSLPLPEFFKISSTLSLGVDYKNYSSVSFQTNNSYFRIRVGTDAMGNPIYDYTALHEGQNPLVTKATYFPFNIGLNGSIPDKFGTTFFNASANFTLSPMSLQGLTTTNVTRTTNTMTGETTTITNIAGLRHHYVTLQFGADREQKIYKDWAVKLHADGQWADGPLFSNEKFGMGGTSGVRGYSDGDAYGDAGWRVTVEPHGPDVDIGMVDGNKPFWIRSSVFMDYGEIYDIGDAPAGFNSHNKFWGTGAALTANIGDHLDARLTVAWPLLASAFTPAGTFHVYFGVGLQF